MMDPLTELELSLKQLSRTSHGRRAFLAALPILLSACASTQRHRHREGDNTGQETELTVEQERQMTREYLPKMRQEYPALPDAETQQYLQDLGQRIVAQNQLNGRPYRYQFTVVKSKTINAFALPAGQVFVTTPLFLTAESEAELAGVVGHEIGHIQARHTAERLQKAKDEQGKSLLYTIGGALLGGAAGFGLGKILCNKQDRECLRRASMYGAMAGGAGGLLIQKFAFMAHSREDEMEADRIGFRTSYRAGYHRDYIGKFYQKLYALEQKYQKDQSGVLAGFADAMSTHPPGRERVQQMQTMGQQVPIQARAIVSTRDFERIQKRIKKLA